MKPNCMTFILFMFFSFCTTTSDSDTDTDWILVPDDHTTQSKNMTPHDTTYHPKRTESDLEKARPFEEKEDASEIDSLLQSDKKEDDNLDRPWQPSIQSDLFECWQEIRSFQQALKEACCQCLPFRRMLGLTLPDDDEKDE